MSQFKGTTFAPILTHIHTQAFKKPWTEQNFVALLKLPTTIGWSNEYGFLLASDLGDALEILTIAVLPSHQHQGHASELMAEMLTWAKDNHKQSIFLEVARDNLAAQKLYLKNGFVQTGIRPNYYQQGQNHIDAICMTLSL